MIIVLAGRRVDAEGATEPRFPLQSIERVRSEIRVLLEKYRPTALVASAAAGADLLALEEAGKMGIRRRIVLPFEPQRFRDTSVTDRPGDWGSLFDKVYAETKEAGGVVFVRQEDPKESGVESDDEKYRQVTRQLFDVASTLARRSSQSRTATRPQVMALAIWDGVSRGPDDITDFFIAEARRRNIPVEVISTL